MTRLEILLKTFERLKQQWLSVNPTSNECKQIETQMEICLAKMKKEKKKMEDTNVYNLKK